MATFGSIKEFCPGSDSVRTYVQRVELYFVANSIPEDKQLPILLTSIGASTYDRLSELLAPVALSSKSVSDIFQLLQTHFEPKRVQIAERFNFRRRQQEAGETIGNYDAALRKLAIHCNFGERLEEELRDQMVCGLRNEALQRRLLTELDLTYAKTIEICRASELAEKNATTLRQVSEVHTVSQHPPTPRNQTRDCCYRCGGKHSASSCRFKDAICHFCKKPGHLVRVCRAKAKHPLERDVVDKPKPRVCTHCVHMDGEQEDVYTLFHMGESNKAPYLVELSVNGAPLHMEVDTGAAVSLISEATYRSIGDPLPQLHPTTVRLRTYSGEQLTVLGSLAVAVKYRNQEADLTLLVVKGCGPSLLGRDWLSAIRLDWKSLCVHRTTGHPLAEILDRHKALFRPELGLAKSIQATLYVEPNCAPRFCKARSVPYALREKVEKELDRLQAEGIIEPVPFSDWAAPIVPVLKRDGSVRICGDYKLTVNQAAQLDQYPLPRIEDLFARVSGGKHFSKLDIAHAYQQIALEEDSKQYVTINTHRGLYRYNRLPFGVHSAPAIFQRAMEGILRDVPSTVVYIDDVLITGKTQEDHLKNLDLVLSRLEKEGLSLRREKCSFMLSRVEYLGHVISSDGLQPSEGKIRAITDSPPPQNIAQLRSFLGMVNYYGKFLKHLSSRLAPLYRLLQQRTPWRWGAEERTVFEAVKKQLSSPPILEHYDPEKPLSLACDASPYGVGAVLSHVQKDGTEKPIAFASRTLSSAERKYSQLDKEALAIVFGVKRFHHYLFGRSFSIASDHKPLQHLLSESRSVPTMASARLQRWALTLSAYHYTITYRPGEKLANADVLSRLPLPEAPDSVPLPGDVICLLQTLQSSPITAGQIKCWTDRDPILSRVRNMVSKGWIEAVGEELRPYQQHKDELSVLDGCLLRGSRVIVPRAGRAPVLDLLHDGHPGITRMKSIARQIVWWPNIDSDIIKKVQECTPCQVNQKDPASAPAHVWEWPKKPWARLHIDHAGPFQGRLLLIIIDAHSKWIEAVPVSSTSTAATTQVLRRLFATHGIPELLISDNGTAFTSHEFRQFVERNGIRHRTSSPYHPATNGLAERAVQVIKNGLRKNAEGDMELRLARFLFHYRNTPHSTTGLTPAELLLGRKPRTHLDLIHPDIAANVRDKQYAQKEAKGSKTSVRSFKEKDKVYVRNFQRGDKWVPGIIAKTLGSRSFLITLDQGMTVRRHLDHIKARYNKTTEAPEDDSAFGPFDPPGETEEPGGACPDMESLAADSGVRRSSRIRHPPDRFTPGIN